MNKLNYPIKFIHDNNSDNMICHIEIFSMSCHLFNSQCMIYSFHRRRREENEIVSSMILDSQVLEMNGQSSNCSTPSSLQSISKSNLLSKYTARLRVIDNPGVGWLTHYNCHSIWLHFYFLIIQGEIVQIKPIVYKSVTQTPLKQRLTPKAVKYLLQVYRLKHENITRFLAIQQNCVQIEFTFVFVWEYCSRGTLFDVIARTDIKLDWNFKISLIGDIIRVLNNWQYWMLLNVTELSIES